MPNYYASTAAKGAVNIMLEGQTTPGMQLLLAATPVISTVTGFSAPSGSTGMRLYVRITNWTASGTITISGTGSPSNTETYNIAAPTLQQTQSPQLSSNDYVSVNAYTAITNITTTGLTNGTITVYGIQAGKYQVPSIMKSKRKPKIYSPNEHNTLLERDKKLLQQIQETTIDEVKQDVYSDISLWWPYIMMGAPTATATIPASPLVVVASAAITGSTSTLTIAAQPTAPGMKLIFTVTAFTTQGTLTINGTSNGISTSETINITATGTVYSSNVYSAISSIANTSTAATLGVTGVFGWSLTFLSGQQKYTAAIEWFDGAGSWIHPFVFATEGDFDAKVKQEITVTMKGKAQDKLAIGDRTTSPLSGTNRITALGVNLNDMPLIAWQTAVYIDPVTGTAGSTVYADMQELKVSLKTPDEDHWTFTNSQVYNRVFSGKRECMIDATINFIDMVQYEQYRQMLKQYLNFAFLGPYIGTSGGTTYQKSWTWTIPFRTDGDFEITSEPSKAIVEAKAKFRAEYDSGIGGSYKLVVVTQSPPTYPN